MRIETNSIKKGEQEQGQTSDGDALYDSSFPLEKKSKKNRRKQKQHQRGGSAMQNKSTVQKLFETCTEVFKGPGTVPIPSDVQRIRSVLDNLKPEDLGLSEDMPYFRTSEARVGAPPVTYIHLYDCGNFSICIFCLPPSAMIPLHNHPGMTVFSKLLFGSMHIKSYDWDTGASDNNSPSNCKGSASSHIQLLKSKPGNAAVVRLAKVCCDDVYTTPCHTSILYPASGGNMHRFTGVTACAVLDVLGPPYSTNESDPEGRHCTYYRDFPYPSFSGDAISVGDEGAKHAWLEEIDEPSDFVVVGADYSGPKIVES